MAGKSRLNMFCVDNSDFSLHAFDWYVENHHKQDDTIFFIHVYDIPSLPSLGLFGGEGAAMYEVYQNQVEDSHRIGNDIKKRYGEMCQAKKLKFEFFMAEAHYKPGHVICHLAEEKRVDSIILGQRGLGTISRALLGSTSDYVLHHSHVPVIVVPTEKKK